MLKTLRDSNRRVVGIVINNKKFSLPRDVCLALGIEEDQVICKAKEANEKLKTLKLELSNTYFQGFSRNLQIEVQFESDNSINFQTGKIEFIGDWANLTPESRKFGIELINGFILALNSAISDHTYTAKLKIEKLSKKSA